MIVTRPFQDAVRGFGRSALDLPVAALAGFAVAFLAFAMPGDLLTSLVRASGLPSVLAAAEPPLGLKARAGVGLAGALAAFGLAFLLLRLLDRTGLERARPPAAADEEEDAPRLRRRDFHPDASVRRPISAARDLGEPAPPPLESARAATPVWLAQADVEPEPVAEAQIEPEPAASEVELQPAAAARGAHAPAADTSLAHLMARLEQGLARHRRRQVFASPPQSAPQVFPEARDDRLQSAIESLQRLAARGD